uniref:Peptidase C19 ubiquitin carboxyl-terminal hydrolase domain-containing protein n=1 Tax=Brassica campestris TaxID=3711 RepID=M4D9D3_BRACM
MSFRASFRTNHVTLTWRNLTDSDSSNPCLSSSLLFKASLIQREREDASVDFLKDSAVNFADSESIVEMESPKVHEAGKVEETHQKVDPESEESKEDPNATRVLALDMILKEANGLFDFLVTILEVLPLWRSVEEPLSSKFEVYHQVAKKICNRCKLVTSAFKDFAFENILKVIRIALMMMTCDKEGCGKQNYVERVISKLPAVFAIAVEWEKNETEEDIFATTSVLATEIDISEIFKYEGDSLFTKYRLVSMVCCHGDQYSCIAYENRSWVIHFGSQNEVSGDWNRVLSIFAKLKIRPEILLFENVMGRDQIVSRN